MDTQELYRLVRERYPFPIAYAYKKTLGVLHTDDVLLQLKCICETAETIVRFLALIAVAQVRHDLLNNSLPFPEKLQNAINLNNPTFGRWQHIPRDICSVYQDACDRLIVPELFDFCYQQAPEGALDLHPVQTQIIDPLQEIHNTFVHDSFPDNQLPEKVAEGKELLDLLLEALQFLAHYQLSFTQRITVDIDDQHVNQYTHDLTVFTGCFSPFGRESWRSAINLNPGLVVLLSEERYLDLDPFLIFTSQYHHVPDLFVLANVLCERPVYLSSQFGVKLTPEDGSWTEGRGHQDTFHNFLRRLGKVSQAAPLAEETSDTQEEAPLSIAEVFERKYKPSKRPVQHISPYKFLDYYNPEDQDIFFGRDREIRILQQKFYNSRLLVLHGESGTGKTSLIRAGLMPRLSPEVYVPVYVRVLQEPLLNIQRELIRQLELKEDYSDSPRTLRSASESQTRGSPDMFPPLTPGVLFQRIKDFLGALPNLTDSPAQRAFVASAGLDHPLEQQLHFGLPQGQFVELLVSILSKYGQLADGRQALEAVLETSQQYVGQDRRLYCETLLQALRRQPQPFISSQQAATHQSADSLAEFLLRVTTRISKTVVIVLDQFEEFFLRFPEEVRRPFKAELGVCLATSGLDIKVLISLRSDYFARLAEFEDAIPQMFTHQLHLTRLTETQALAAVIKPPQLMGIRIDEAMVRNKLLPELLAEDGGIEPPLLQIVCDTLYQNAQSEDRQEISMVDYEAIGDVRACLGNYLDTKLRQFGKQQPVARTVLKALVTAEGTKRASLAGELLSRMKSTANLSVCDSVEELKTGYLDRFVLNRLLRVEEIEGEIRYELSHDYLASHIEAWIEESEREVTKTLELIDRAYEAYQSTGLLLERSALQMITPFEDQIVLPSAKQDFLNRSKTQVRKQRRGLFLKVAVLLLAVIVVLGGVFGYQKYQDYQALKYQKEQAEKARKDAEQQAQIAQEARMQAERQTRVAQARQLAVQAQTALEKYPQRSLLLAVEALNVTLREGEPRIPAAEEVLRQALTNIGGIGLSGGIVTISSDSRWLITKSEDGVARLWNLTTPDPTDPVVLCSYTDSIKSVAISPDSRWLVVVGKHEEKIARLWNLMADNPVAASIDLRGHKEGVSTMAFSPDSHWLATGSSDATVRLWDLTIPAPAVSPIVLYGHESKITDVTFSPNGRWLATDSDDPTIRLWDLTASDLTVIPVVLQSHKESIATEAFSPDGHWLVTTSGDDTTQLWDLTAANPAVSSVVLHVHRRYSDELMFSPDNHWLVTGSDDGTARLWDLTASDPVGNPVVLRGHDRSITTMAFSPDSHWLVTSSWDNTARLWDLTAHNPAASSVVLHVNRGYDDLMFSPDNHWLVTIGEAYTTQLWDLTAPNPAASPVVLRGHEKSITTVAFSPDNRWLVTASSDGITRLWDLTVADLATASVILHGHEEAITTIAFSPDSHWLATDSNDNTSRLWDLAVLSPAAAPITLVDQKEEIEAMAISSDHHWLVTVSMNNTVRLWDLTAADLTKNPVALRVYWEGSLAGLMPVVTFSPDSHWLITNGDAITQLWDLTVPDLASAPVVLRGREYDIRMFTNEMISSNVAISSDNRWLVIGKTVGIAELWDLTASNPEAASLVLRGHEGWITTVAISPDNRWLVTGGNDATVRLWDLTAPDPMITAITLRGHEKKISGGISAVAFSPDSCWLATGGEDATARLWDLTAPDPAASSIVLPGHKESIERIAFSSDNCWLATGSGDATAQLWDLTSSDPATSPVVLTGHESRISALAFSPDNHWLITGSGDANGRLWDLTALDPVATSVVLRGHEAGISTVAFSPDSHRLVTGSSDDTVRLWPLRLDELIKIACRTAGRNLSLNEWEQYFPDEDYHSSCSDILVYPGMITTARDLAKSGDIEGATAIFQKALELDPSLGLDPIKEARKWAAEGLVRKGRLLLMSEGKIQEAIASFEEAKTLDPGLDIDLRQEVKRLGFNGLKIRVKSLAQQGKIKEAIAAYEEIKTLHPNLELPPIAEARKWAAEGLIDKGRELAYQGEIEEAIAVYEEAKILYPSLDVDPAGEMRKITAEILVYKSLQLISQGEIEEFIAVYKEAKALDPAPEIFVEEPEVSLLFCMYGSLAGYGAEVIDACERATVPGSEDEEFNELFIRLLRGIARTQAGNNIGAIEDFQALIREMESDEERKGIEDFIPIKDWINTLRTGENPFTPEVLEALRSLIEDDGNSMKEGLSAQDNPDEELAMYQKQVGLNPNHENAWYAMGTVLVQQGKLDEAILAFQKQVKVKPDHKNAWYSLIFVFYEQGNLNEAVAAYQKTLEIVPDTPEDKEELRYIRLKLTRRLEQGNLGSEALVLYQKLLSLAQHDDENFLDLLKGLMVGFMREGKFDDALTAYQSIKKIDPNYKWRANLWRKIGEEFWEQDKLDQAAKAFEQELQLQPDDAFLLCEDGELALVQGNMTRFHTRITTVQSLVTSDNTLFAMLPFYVWLSNPEQGWGNIMTAITQLKPDVRFPVMSVIQNYYEDGRVEEIEYTWEASGIAPVIEQLDAETQQIAQHFIAFFEGRIDLETLKTQLTEKE